MKKRIFLSGSAARNPCVFRPRKPHLSRAGSALLLVLWALLMLSAAVLGWAVWIQDGLEIHADANRGVEARAMAYSGIAVGLNPGITRLSPEEKEELAPGMSYSVAIKSESARLNINWLLRGESPRKLTILKQWLENRGLDFNQRELLVDCMLDYVDADSLPRTNGREDGPDYHPANREFLTIDEIAQVAGSEPLVAKPGWKDDLTLETNGPIDLAAAPEEILRLLPGLGEARIARLVQYRRGRDGLESTSDDNIFNGIHDVQVFLSMSDAEFKELQGLATVNDPVVRITGRGYSGNVSRQIEVIARKDNAVLQILSWKE